MGVERILHYVILMGGTVILLDYVYVIEIDMEKIVLKVF